MCFSPLVESLEARETIGTSLICLTVLNIALNIGSILRKNLKEAYRNFKLK